VVKFVFYSSKLRKQPFLLKISNSWPPSGTHACVLENVRATPLKRWYNFKRFNTILISGSQFVLKPAPRLEGKVIFSPLARFDVLFYGLSSLTSIVSKVPRTRNWIGTINLATV